VLLTNTSDGLLSFPLPALLTPTALGILHAYCLSCATSQRFADVCVAKSVQIQTEQKQGMQKGAIPSSQTCLSFGMVGMFKD